MRVGDWYTTMRKGVPVEYRRMHLTINEMKALGEYSRTVPTGVTIGKTWRMQLRDGTWLIRRYVVCDDPTCAGIETYWPVYHVRAPSRPVPVVNGQHLFDFHHADEGSQ